MCVGVSCVWLFWWQRKWLLHTCSRSPRHHQPSHLSAVIRSSLLLTCTVRTLNSAHIIKDLLSGSFALLSSFLTLFGTTCSFYCPQFELLANWQGTSTPTHQFLPSEMNTKKYKVPLTEKGKWKQCNSWEVKVGNFEVAVTSQHLFCLWPHNYYCHKIATFQHSKWLGSECP